MSLVIIKFDISLEFGKEKNDTCLLELFSVFVIEMRLDSFKGERACLLELFLGFEIDRGFSFKFTRVRIV